MARVSNALVAAKELKEANDEVKLIFEGAGTKWIPELSKPDHRLNGTFSSVKDKVAGACSFCAAAFGVKDEIRAAGIPLLGEYKGHPSLKHLVSEGYQVITY